MKKLLLLTLFAFLLTACTGSNPDIAGLDGGAAKPKVPSMAKRPKLPQANLQANLLGASRNSGSDEKKDRELDMEGLVNRIDQKIEETNITEQDIERGWYFASKDDRKWGTPKSWVWIDEGAKSHWISPDALLLSEDLEADKLCRETGGHYVISCIDRDLPHCEHIPASECQCPVQTKWHDSQGCLLVDKDEEFVKTTEEELGQGWYFGLKTQKRLGTPEHWIWVEKGLRSRWQNVGS